MDGHDDKLLQGQQRMMSKEKIPVHTDGDLHATAECTGPSSHMRREAGIVPNLEEHLQIRRQLEDYQMQLMLLEQENKKRLMMARQEQYMQDRVKQQNDEQIPANKAISYRLAGGLETVPQESRSQLGLAEEEQQQQQQSKAWMTQREKERMKTRLMTEQKREEERKGIREGGCKTLDSKE
ncbi:hypothetical protein F4775DRAFT_345013 [Biscogniauxia sp. FL1348]|nr:hypothetical protein F4775DRAFT_83712 [Biscogniauxia sp. FL1348]KAI0595691.1 hypothetical protein F4775DRAFT_345013 [Biscogniauxia sp. FL1348]